MPTWADLKARVESELDLEQEDFINATDLLYYANKAINVAENLVLTLNEDYFLNKASITLVSGQSQYDLPAGIYAQKIRRILYDNNGIQYEVRRFKNLSHTILTRTGDYYKYLVTNDANNGLKINIYPTPNETGTTLSVWFLRNASEIALLTDDIDLPEAYDYVTQHIIDSCINKERATPDAPPSGALKEQERLLIEALTDRFPDDDNMQEPDTSFYRGVN